MPDTRQRKALRVLAGDPDPPMPTLAEVLYAGPNPDGSRKLCGNCGFYVPGLQACVVVGGVIMPTQVCGYHVFGHTEGQPGTLVLQVVPPDMAGLIDAPTGGTSCNNCRSYRPQRGGDRCRAVGAADGQLAQVDAMGCCARWHAAT